MTLHGKNFIGGETSGTGPGTFFAIDPVNGSTIPPAYGEATQPEIDRAARMATDAFGALRALSPEQMGALLYLIAEKILAASDDLIRRANLETALPEGRLSAEHTRTVQQIMMFAELVREGSWVDARIDRAIPNRTPAPKPLVKRMLIPIGPVAVFGAGNFPLAFSVAGGDTISALAAGNPVVVKAHPAHPGTSEIAAGAVQAAVEESKLPGGVFSLLHGRSHEVGLALVRHPAIKAVGFTGSLQGGRTLFDAATARQEPIPVFAEMGSTNPVFVLPGALASDGDGLARGIIQSVTLGVGQFCTKPGLVFGASGADWDSLLQLAGHLVAATPPGRMAAPDWGARFSQSVAQARKIAGVTVLGAGDGSTGATAFATDLATFRQHEFLREELFGPAVFFISCNETADLESVARELPGQLTASIHGTEEDLTNNAPLVQVLQQKAGRLIFNGYPTGLEVCPSMYHGGPYPATTAPHFTSVGTAAIVRFARPVCFQNFPDAALPAQLRDQNIGNIWRLVDGHLTKDNL